MSLTAQGFVRSTISDIKSRLDAAMILALGPVNTDADSLVGQVDGIVSEALDNVWQAVQDCYDSMYARSAEGTSLYGAVAFRGLKPNKATPTEVYAVCYGDDGTNISIGNMAHADVQYITETGGTISRLAAIDVQVSVIGVTPNTNYQLSINSVRISYVSPATPASPDILAGIAAAINASSVSGVVIAQVVDNFIDVQSSDLMQSFAIYPISGLSLTKIGSNVLFQCTQPGATPLPVGALVSIDTPVFGWNSIYNFFAGETGSDDEEDQQLRLRFDESTDTQGYASMSAIKSRLLGVAGVIGVSVYENRSITTSPDGIPPKSVYAVVVGGFDADVANMLFKVKGGGIETYGTTQVIVTDSNGDGQPTYFSRPAPAYIWVIVTILSFESKEPISANLPETITDTVVKTGSALNPDDDVIPQRFIGPIYAVTTGIKEMTITMAATNSLTDVPVYSDSAISISTAQYATFDPSRVQVLGV